MLLAVVLGNTTQAQQVQQDCDEVVMAYYGISRDYLDRVPEHKQWYFCTMSQLAFEYTDELPANALVLDITDLYDKQEQRMVDLANYTDDAMFFNLFRYDYIQMQGKYGLTTDIYFTLHNNGHQYLLLRNNEYFVRRVNDLAVEREDRIMNR